MYTERNYCGELSVRQVLGTALHVVYSSFYTQLQGWPHEWFQSPWLSFCPNKTYSLYGSACMGDYLVMAMKKFQQVHFQGQHECCLMGAFINEAQGNKWVHTHQKLMPPFLSVKPTLSKVLSLRQRDLNTKNLLPLWRSKRCMIVKYWFPKLNDILLCMTLLKE